MKRVGFRVSGLGFRVSECWVRFDRVKGLLKALGSLFVVETKSIYILRRVYTMLGAEASVILGKSLTVDSSVLGSIDLNPWTENTS